MLDNSNKWASGCGGLALLALASLQCQPARAQASGAPSPSPQDSSEAPALEEVVVTARKRQERLEDIPVSVVAVTEEQLAAHHVQTIDDIKASIPNLNIAVAEGPDVPNVVLRGVGSFDVTQGVGFYVNDVQQFLGSAVPFEDVERVEVLRGPQGTLYGGSNIGGAIKYVTKLPSDTFSSSFSFEGGGGGSGQGTRNYTGVVSGPIIGDSFLGRFTYFNNHTDGFVYNTTLNELVDRADFRGGRLTLEYKQDATTAVVHLYFAELQGLSLDPLYITPDTGTYSTQVVFDRPPVVLHRTEDADLHFERRFDGVTLTSISAMSYAHDYNDGDFDLSQYPIAYGLVNYWERDYSEELRLQSNGSSPLTWIAGVFYLHRHLPFLQDFYQNLTPFPFVPTSFLDFRSITDEVAVQESAFANATYTLGRWAFEAGTRVEHDKDTLSVSPSSTSPAFSEDSFSNTVSLPRGSVSYHFTRDFMTYASIARGFTPGGVFNGALGTTTFHPETTLNYEAGLKGTPFDNRVSYGVDAFFIDYKNRIFQQQTVLPPNPNIKSNLGDSHNYGMEASIDARATRELTVGAAVGFTIAKWYRASYVDPVTHTPVSLDDLTGPFTPAYQASLRADWEHPLAEQVVVGVRGDVSVQGRQYWDPQDLRVQHAYSIANLGVHLTLYSHWDFSVSANNLFNRRYNTDFFYGPALGAPFDLGKLGRPRLVTARLSWTY